jgi:aminoglycoside 3-N-acetyltransferase
MKLSKRLVAKLPPGLATRARSAKRHGRRLRYRMRQTVRPMRLEPSEVARALRAAGIDNGDTVFFQSAMSSFGEIVGGAEAVIDALEGVVGEEGLIVMPAFPVVGNAIDYLASDPTFDVRSTPSTMGAITEKLRARPGTVRSVHPTHSVIARGPGAAEIVSGHELASTPFGRGTPFAKLIERDAWQVWFGCGIGAFTTYHAFECLHGDFPLRVFAQRSFSIRCIDANGKQRIVETLVHDSAVSAHRIDANPGVARRWRSLLLERRVVRSVRLGRGEILVARLRPLMTELERLLGEGITIYDLPVPVAGAQTQ